MSQEIWCRRNFKSPYIAGGGPKGPATQHGEYTGTIFIKSSLLLSYCRHRYWPFYAKDSHEICTRASGASCLRAAKIPAGQERASSHTHTGNEREKKWISEPCPCEKRERSDCSRLARDFFLSVGQFSWFVQLQAVGLPIPPPHFSPPSIPQPPSTPLCPSYSW